MSLYPAAVQHPVPYPTPSLVEPLGLVLHVQQGNNSLAGYFADPGNGVLSHFWISKTGVVEQYKDGDHQSWAQMAGNATYHSVETEGFATEPLTAQQVSALADLYEWGHETYGWALSLAEKPGDPGFGWHGMGGALWGGHTGCPGDLRKPARGQVLQLLQGDDMPTAEEIANAIFQRQADTDAALRAGTPLTPDQVLVVQATDLLVHRTQAILTVPKGTP